LTFFSLSSVQQMKSGSASFPTFPKTMLTVVFLLIVKYVPGTSCGGNRRLLGAPVWTWIRGPYLRKCTSLSFWGLVVLLVLCLWWQYWIEGDKEDHPEGLHWSVSCLSRWRCCYQFEHSYRLVCPSVSCYCMVQSKDVL
jgi:hypothetical protein